MMRALNKDPEEVTISPCTLSFITCLFFRQRQARVNIPCCGDLVQLEGEQVIKEITPNP